MERKLSSYFFTPLLGCNFDIHKTSIRMRVISVSYFSEYFLKMKKNFSIAHFLQIWYTGEKGKETGANGKVYSPQEMPNLHTRMIDHCRWHREYAETDTSLPTPMVPCIPVSMTCKQPFSRVQPERMTRMEEYTNTIVYKCPCCNAGLEFSGHILCGVFG